LLDAGVTLRRAPILGEDMSGGAAQLFGYGQSVKKLPRPRYPAQQVVGEWFPGEAPLAAGGEREELA